MAIDSTPGSATADSYVSVVEADSYFGASFAKESWALLSVPNKEVLLKESTRLLDQFFDWFGYMIIDSSQSLRWPRHLAQDADGRLIDNNVVPKILKHGTCELAYYISNSTDGFTDIDNPLSQLKIGPIKLDFSTTVSESAIPKIVSNMLRSIGDVNTVSSNQVKQVGLVRT